MLLMANNNVGLSDKKGHRLSVEMKGLLDKVK